MRRRALCLALVALGVLVGLALRIAVAWHASGAGRDWEADGFVRCWEPSAFAPASRMRPPLVPWLFHGLAQVLDARSVLGVRLLSVAVSLIGLAGALVLARAIALRRAPREPLCGPGACAVTWCWALLPTLVAGAASPTGDALLGGLLCLAAAAALALPARPGVLRAALLALALLLVLLAGGIVAACAVVAALLVFLAPLPPLRAAAPPLLAVLAACLGGWWLQRGEDAARPWRPDNAPAWSLVALVGEPLAQGETEPLDPDLRAQVAWQAAARGADALGPSGVARAGGRRLAGDLLNPARFDGMLPPAWPGWMAGLLDLALRGALLVLALATAATASVPRRAGWPRAGLVAGALLLAAGTVLAATGPFALGPLDTLLIAVAGAGFGAAGSGSGAAGAGTGGTGAGLAAAEARRRRVMPRALLAGAGALLAAAWLGALTAGRELSPWITVLYQDVNQGPASVATLKDGGPGSAAAEIFAANLLMDRRAPFLRMPEAARRHALRATELAPDEERATMALVNAEVENLHFDEARRLAATLLDQAGLPTPRGRVLLAWVQQSERDWRTSALR